MADEILYAVADSIATITLNRPERRNALNTALMEALAHRFDALESDTSVRAVVIRGAGQAFCSGRDLNEMSRRQDDGLEPEADVIALFQQIEASRHPTIAMVHGAAYAGGCELALHCDFRVAADVARFAMPLARIGLVVPFALGQKLVEIIGPAFTRQILLTGQPVDAGRAYEMGMVHTVVPAADLERATYDLAKTIAGNAPLSLAGMKSTIRRALSLRERVEHKDLDEIARRARASADAREGVRAMLEHRKPTFRGQ
ncbi:MAG: enoyl-CoA hydratase [Candidatus Rokuibacteriota bacterium]|nr:MAG: enoyl-CoA hydratase [Candidatus Rokubacteria bacterium]